MSKTEEKRGLNKHAQALGKRGGLARAARLSPEQRKEIASKASRKRWKDHVKQPKRYEEQP